MIGGPAIAVRFLGTGGARFVTAKQIRATGGMWLRFGADDCGEPETQIHVDPGPGALVRALESVPPCEPEKLDAIVLSHKHLDHASDVNAMIEAMTVGGFRPRGKLLAPRDAFEGEPVIFPYAARFVPEREVLSERSGPYRVGNVAIETSVRHLHGVETYGLHFAYRGTTVSYLPCTRAFAGLAEDYARHDPDVLILNVLRYRDVADVDHLTLDDARAIVGIVRPKVAVFTHFGTRMLEAGPERIAREFEDEFGFAVRAARDGWTLDVAAEVAAVARG